MFCVSVLNFDNKSIFPHCAVKKSLVEKNEVILCYMELIYFGIQTNSYSHDFKCLFPSTPKLIKISSLY